MMASAEITEKLARIDISRAVPTDATDIARINRDGWLSTYTNEELGITVEDVLSMDFDGPDRIAKRMDRIKTLTDAEGNIWVARIDNEIVGYCVVQRFQKHNKISALYIASEHRRKGVGNALIVHAINWLGRNKDVILEVVTFNACAIAFYQQMGFRRGPLLASRWSFPSGRTLPEMEMWLSADED